VLKVTGCPEDGSRTFPRNVGGLYRQGLRGCSATDGSDVNVSGYILSGFGWIAFRKAHLFENSFTLTFACRCLLFLPEGGKERYSHEAPTLAMCPAPPPPMPTLVILTSSTFGLFSQNWV